MRLFLIVATLSVLQKAPQKAARACKELCKGQKVAKNFIFKAQSKAVLTRKSLFAKYQPQRHKLFSQKAFALSLQILANKAFAVRIMPQNLAF